MENTSPQKKTITLSPEEKSAYLAYFKYIHDKYKSYEHYLAENRVLQQENIPQLSEHLSAAHLVDVFNFLHDEQKENSFQIKCADNRTIYFTPREKELLIKKSQTIKILLADLEESDENNKLLLPHISSVHLEELISKTHKELFSYRPLEECLTLLNEADFLDIPDAIKTMSKVVTAKLSHKEPIDDFMHGKNLISALNSNMNKLVAQQLMGNSPNLQASLRNIINAENIYANPFPRTFKDSCPLLAFNPDNSILAITAFRTVMLYNLKDRQFMKQLTHEQLVSSVAFGPDSKTVAVGCSNGALYVWNRLTNNDLFIIHWGHTNKITSVAFSPDNTMLASSSLDNTIRLWNLQSGEPLRVFQTPDFAKSLTFSSDNNGLAACIRRDSGNFFSCLWNLSTEQQLSSNNNSFGAKATIFNRNNKFITVSSVGNTIYVNNNFMGQCEMEDHPASWVNSFALSADGHTLASGSSHQTKLWNVQAAHPVLTLIEDSEVESVALSPDNTMLAAQDYYGKVCLFNIALFNKLRNNLTVEQTLGLIYLTQPREQILDIYDNHLLQRVITTIDPTIQDTIMKNHKISTTPHIKLRRTIKSWDKPQKISTMVSGARPSFSYPGYTNWLLWNRTALSPITQSNNDTTSVD
ncbi:MAG: WD domain, G-beta repeat [Candidatus Dependentiae bacterium ADurb.Bin331]|nr:MAG: WD domain, G-beta repeat [Candidatus Dependentiae bacterium ADurb.Bin331]